MVQAPIFHVNGDEPESVVARGRPGLGVPPALQDATSSSTWSGYRRWGHNEGDEPSYTQPLMYAKIKSHTSVGQLYSEHLVRSGAISREELDKIWAEKKAQMQREGDGGALGQIARRVPVARGPVDAAAMWGRLRTTLQALSTVPDGLRAPSQADAAAQAARRAAGRARARWTGPPRRRWPSGTLLLEGVPVRLSGQDTAPRHVQPAPRRALRRAHGQGVRAAQLHRPRGHALRGPRQPALRGRGDGLRVRVRGGRAPRARDVGGAVRRLLERRPGHRRPVPGRRRRPSGASPRASSCCCPTGTRGRARSTRARASSAS